ncbi:MAG: RdgB/HAM1 family non-canonical purine NTP pyrophosphatase [Campylobacteraceae bacterium]|nr:RdgB/HAM1 family non-canonical purine NTP pyrophosphatase [Campylobacteraceae bacterium]
MQIVLATSNQEKIVEIKEYLSPLQVKAWGELIEEFEIVEDGKTFKENALIKSRIVFQALKNDGIIVLSDDSGLSVPLLGGEPGIYSARYAGIGAGYKKNTQKLVDTLRGLKVKKTPAHYTTCMAISSKWGDFSVHGYMYGYVIDEQRGDKGFGYDPIFIPLNENRTLGQMDSQEKLAISHRSNALKLAKQIIDSLPKE